MPSKEPNMQEQGFRSRVWGFNKDDVLAYMNALANEAQQQEAEYQEQIKQLQTQVDKLKREQTNARACVEKLQTDLSQAIERADDSEKKLAEANDQLKESENRADSYQSRYKESQQSILEWQFKYRDLQKQLEEQKTATPAAPQEEPAAEPAPPAPVHIPEPRADVTERARIEARKILADARLSAENAEQRLQEEAEEQKARMTENARELAAGVMLLRDRLARVDEKLSSASLDLENATSAIYRALDQTAGDLEALGADLRAFGELKPTASAAPVTAPQPEPQPASKPAQPQHATLRPKASAQPVQHKNRPARQQPAAPVKRLRRASYKRRPVSQDLLDALDRLGDDDKE